MRTFSSRHQQIYSSGFCSSHARVTIDGTDVTSLEGYNFLVGGDINFSESQPVATASVRLARQIEGFSLSPLMAGSKINASGVLVDVGQSIEIELAVAPAGQPAQADDWVSRFKGRITDVDWGSDVLVCQCQDLAGELQDNFIQAQRLYGSASPSSPADDLETVMQDILNDNGTGVTLYSPTGTGGTPFQSADSPDWQMLSYYQSKMSVLAALRVLADQIGYDIRYIYNSNTSDWELTLYEGDRTLAAVGSLAFTGQPSNNETFAVNGVTYTAKTSGAGVDEFNIGSSRKGTAQNCADMLNAGSDSANLYALKVDEGASDARVLIFWDAFGTSGNSITFTESMSNVAADGGGTLGGYRAGRSPTSAYTFDASQYRDLAMVKQSLADVRNSGKLSYYDSDLGERVAIVRKAPSSIASYGERYFEVTLRAGDQIDTIAEAFKLIDHLISDLATPQLQKSADVGPFIWAQLGDLYTFAANGVHYDSDQEQAVEGFRISFAAGSIRTTLQLVGKPQGGAKRWFDLEGGRGRGPAIDEKTDAAASNPAVVAGLGFIEVEYDDPLSMTPPIGDWAYTECHVGTSAAFTVDASTLKAKGKETRFKIGGLTPGTTYYSKLRIVDTQGNVASQSTEVSVAVQEVGAYHENLDGLRLNMVPNGDFGQNTLAVADSPPDAFTVSNATWGSGGDIYEETATYQQTGKRSIKFFGSIGSADGVQEIVSDFIPIAQNKLYRMTWWWTCSETNVSDNDARGRLAYDLYDKDKSQLGSTVNLGEVQVATAHEWKKQVSSQIFSLEGNTGSNHEDARYIRWRFGRKYNGAGPASFEAYLDRMVMFPQRPVFKAYRSSAQTITSGGNRVVEFTTQLFDLGGATIGGTVYGYDWSTNPGRYTCLEPGEYEFKFAVGMDGLASSTAFEAGFLLNGSVEKVCHRQTVSGDVTAFGAMTIALSKGDYVEVYVNHDDSPNAPTFGGESETWFEGSMLADPY